MMKYQQWILTKQLMLPFHSYILGNRVGEESEQQTNTSGFDHSDRTENYPHRDRV